MFMKIKVINLFAFPIRHLSILRGPFKRTIQKLFIINRWHLEKKSMYE